MGVTLIGSSRLNLAGATVLALLLPAGSRAQRPEPMAVRTEYQHAYRAEVQRLATLYQPSVKPSSWNQRDTVRTESHPVRTGGMVGGVVGALGGFVLLHAFNDGETSVGNVYAVLPVMLVAGLLGAFLGAAIAS